MMNNIFPLSFLSVFLMLFAFADQAEAYYAPTTGRFINRDPIQERGGVNVYAFPRNNPTNMIDVLGKYGAEAWVVNDPPKLPSPEEVCKLRKAMMNAYMDRLVKNSAGKTPDCSGTDGCTLVTVIIDLGDPCGSAETGHAGIGVGNEYYDVGPLAQGQYTEVEAGGVQNLNEIINQYYSDSDTGDGVYAVEYCACDENARFIKTYMNKLMDGSMDPTQCASAVCHAMHEGDLSFWNSLSYMVTTPRGAGEIAVGKTNECGKNKGQKANVRILTRP